MVSRIVTKGCAISINNFTAGPSILDFDLSRNKCLQTLELSTHSIDNALRKDSPDTITRHFKHVLSTIQSPTFSQIQFIYQAYSFNAIKISDRSRLTCIPQLSQSEKVEEALRHSKRFGLLRDVHKVRNFQLILRADVSEYFREYVMGMVNEALAAERARGGFSDLFPEPLLVYSPSGLIKHLL